MTSNDVVGCLRKRFTDSEYLCILEAPEDSGRQGGKIDFLAIALWRSRGLGLDAIEIKVSLSDWKREVDAVAKADFWWRHSSRFWVAAPADIAQKIKETLPETWGLLACGPDTGTKVIVRPRQRTPEVLSWETTIGLLRAAADAGLGALDRAMRKGREIGEAEGRARALRETGNLALESLAQAVGTFERLSGVQISDEWNATKYGRLVSLVRKVEEDPLWLFQHVGSPAQTIVAECERMTKDARRAQAVAKEIALAIETSLTPEQQSTNMLAP